jgi:PAS domain S-box-containing protein
MGLDCGVMAMSRAERQHSQDGWLLEAFATADVVGFECDLATGRVRRSPNSVSILGLPVEGDASHWLDILLPEDRCYYVNALQMLTPAAPRYELEYRVKHGTSGRRLWVLDRGEVCFQPDGARAGLRGAVMSLSTRVRRELELRQDGRLSSVAFAAARMGAWHFDPMENVVSCSDELLEMFGLSRSAFDGSPAMLENVMHPDDVQAWRTSGGGPFAATESFEVEFRGRGARGEVRWYLSRGEVARRHDGAVIESYGVIIDITQRKAVEQAAAHLAAIVASSEDAIISKSVAGIVTSWNRGAERLFGYNAAEMVGTPVSRILERGDAEEESILGAIARGETIAAYESIRTRKDGSRVPVSLTASPILDASGRVVGASTIARDLTERLQHLEVLRQSETRLRLALKGARAGAWDYDSLSGQMHWSQEMFELHGLDPAGEVPDERTRLSLIEPAHRERVRSAMKTALAEGLSIAIEFPILRPDGRELWAAMSGDVVMDADGRSLGARGILQDVSERKALEQRQAVLLRELSHRVKNSLAIILSIARQTLHSHNDPRAFVEAFEGRVRSLAQSHNLLTEGEISSARVGDIIRGQLSGLVGDLGDRLELRGPDVSLAAEQATQLGMILHELGTNAVKYGALSSDSGRVSIRWLASRKRLCLTWRERGGPAIEAPPVKSGFGTRLIDSSCKRVSRRFERLGLTARFELLI